MQEAVLVFSRETKRNALYTDSGGFNKWYVPLEWYTTNGTPATITIKFGGKQCDGELQFLRPTPQYLVYQQQGSFNKWYMPKTEGATLPETIRFAITAGGTTKNKVRQLRRRAG